MGEDLKDERERLHGVQRSPSTQDAHHSFSMLSTMIKHGGGIAALHTGIEKDGNSPLTLSLFTAF
jgi:hypothetical protein